MPVWTSMRSGRTPAGVAARRRSASRRRATRRSERARAGSRPWRESAASAHALQAVGAVQGSSPVQPSRRDAEAPTSTRQPQQRLPRRRIERRNPNGPTAQAAAESSPDPDPPLAAPALRPSRTPPPLQLPVADGPTSPSRCRRADLPRHDNSARRYQHWNAAGDEARALPRYVPEEDSQ